jgi:protein-tyrosine phosphatase
LILFLLDIPLSAITDDYCMSEEELLPEKENRMVEILSIGLTEEFASCPKDWVEKMDEYIREKYGGVKEYCHVIGFGDQEQESLLLNLTHKRDV